MLRTAALALLAAGCASAGDLQLTVLPAEFGARYGAACLDGTMPAFWSTGNVNSSVWVVGIEGGGWCFDPAGPNQTIANCAGRARGSLGTSNNLGASNTPGGILSRNATVNPYFHGASLVFIHYCDGTSHTSNAIEPISLDGGSDAGTASTLYFRGRANLVAVFHYLIQNMSLDAATSVVVTGGSAGATTAYLAADEIAAWLPSSARVMIAPDAGFFQDAVDVQRNAPVYRESFIAADPVWNASAAGSLNADCVAANPGAVWRCFFQQYSAPHIRAPLFIFNSAYDMWQVLNDLSLGCVPSTNGQKVAGIPSCNTSQMVTFQAYRDQQLAAMAPTLAVPGTGAFVTSCFVHEQNFDYCSTQPLPNCVGWGPETAMYTVDVEGEGPVNMSDSFFAWYSYVMRNWDSVMAARGAHQAAHRAAVGTAATLQAARQAPSLQVIDQVQFPHNPSCPFPTARPAVAPQAA